STSEAHVWRLGLPRNVLRQANTQTASSQTDRLPRAEHSYLPYGGCMTSVSLAHTDSKTGAGADVWRSKGLGKVAFLIWSCLDLANEQPSAALAPRVQLHQRTIKKYLAILAEHGLAVGDGCGGWRRGDADLDEVARALGVAGEGARQRRRHDD